MKKTVLFLALLCAGLCSFAQSRPVKPYVPFRIYDMQHDGDEISLTELADHLGSTEVLFFGEEHNDTIGHVLELKIFKLLSERYRSKLSLSMEMFETDCQVVLDDYLGGFINEEKLIKEGRTWNNYNDYKPLVEFAKENRIPVIAANAPRRYVSLMSKRGPKSLDSLSNGSKKYLAKLPIFIPTGKYQQKFVDLMGGADNLHSPNMFASQCLWDATMAGSILDAHKEQKKGGLVYHLCGRFHSDEYLGTVRQLYRKDKNLVISTISCFPATDYDQPSLDQYKGLADFVILTEKK